MTNKKKLHFVIESQGKKTAISSSEKSQIQANRTQSLPSLADQNRDTDQRQLSKYGTPQTLSFNTLIYKTDFKCSQSSISNCNGAYRLGNSSNVLGMIIFKWLAEAAWWRYKRSIIREVISQTCLSFSC